MKLRIGIDGFGLKAEAFEDVVAILGRRGRGKTTTATVIVEGLHAAGARFVVADPVGVWFGLKSSRDGRRPGIPVVVMGGDHGDVPLAPESGEIIADFVADPTSPSVVLDLKAFTQGEMVRFMTAFLARLYHVNPGKPLHVVLDEADQFAPQRPMPGEQAMLGAAQRVTKLGRAKGLHPMLITQRPATLSKNVLTQAGLLIAHAITGPQDRNAVDDWIKANADEGERDKFLAELSGLPRGTAYFWSPDIPLFRQVAVRDRETFDSSATPKRGEATKPKALAEVDLEALKGRIAATIERAKAEDPRELRKRIVELQKELNAKRSVVQPPAPPQKAPKRVDVPILKEAHVKRLEAAVEKYRKASEVVAHAAHVAGNAAQVVVGELGAATAKLAAGRVLQPAPKVVHPPAAVASMTSAASGRLPARSSDSSLPTGERLILTAAAQYPDGADRQQLSILTGYKRSTRDTYLQRLREKGHVAIRGDVAMATPEGLAALGPDFEPLPTGPALRAHWLERLPEGERKVLAVLLDHYPRALAREVLDEAAGYKRSTRDTYIQRLQARKLVEAVGRGEVRAAEQLFEGVA